MKKGEIQIIVAGTANSGKSTVVQVIRDALARAGLTFTVKPIHGEDPFVDGGLQDRRLESVANKGTIILEERQVRQSMMTNNYEIVGLEE